MSSAKITLVDVLCEFLEVLVHNVLHTRKLYPDTIFVTRKKYGVAVYQSIHPEVNEYINECFKAVHFHAKNNRLKRLFICFHNEDRIHEKYVFDVLNIATSVESDPLLVDLEQCFRDFIIKLHTSQNYLDQLSEDSSFSIRLETTAYSSLEFNQEPSFEASFEQGIVMDSIEGGIKRKSRLAVFEHVTQNQNSPKRKKFRPNRLDSGDSSPSESELVIDDVEPVKKKNVQVSLSDEPLHLICEWDSCQESYNSWESFNIHLTNHAVEDQDNLKCLWKGCEDESLNIPLQMQHMSYHGYLMRLKNIGQNVVDRNGLPKCVLEEKYVVPIVPNGYTCEWEYCFFKFNTIYDFYTHMEIHIKNNPRVSNEKLNEIIQCCWNGCNIKTSNQYKLAEHVRSHTKERVVACPTCCCLFSNKTKFSDHRKRQLETKLQSYQCSQCLKLFPTERLLRDHMRSHINHYKCTMCDMTCPKPSVLAKHIRYKHIKFKPYKCPQCDKTFVTKSNLDTHIRTHTKEETIKCDSCNFKCRSKIGLTNHYETTHEKSAASYKCHCCKKFFKRGAYLTRHLMKAHNYHWPSGHTRFRYRKDQDNIYRLQTVRYESLEVTQEMIRSESMHSNNSIEGKAYNLKYDNDRQTGYLLCVSASGEQVIKETAPRRRNVLITINDVDEHGNIVRSEVVESEVVREIAKTEEVEIVEHTLPKLENTIESVTVKQEPKKRKSARAKKRKKEKTVDITVKSEVEEETEKFVRYFPIETILARDVLKIELPSSEAD